MRVQSSCPSETSAAQLSPTRCKYQIRGQYLVISSHGDRQCMAGDEFSCLPVDQTSAFRQFRSSKLDLRPTQKLPWFVVWDQKVCQDLGTV
jgi:hypothetical protein